MAMQEREGWGSKVVALLSQDLRAAFADMGGLSVRSVMHMRQFARAWPQRSIVQASLAQLTWYHTETLLKKLDDPDLRLWYPEKALGSGLSRNLLVAQIESELRGALTARGWDWGRNRKPGRRWRQ